MANLPWVKYAVGKRPRHGYSESCKSFDVVSHVAHVDMATRIIQDDILQPQYVESSHSVMRRRRFKALWVSPNTWADGSFYGNVKFALDWDDLIANKRFYWVEAVKHPNHTALHFVISERDLSKWSELTPYDPTVPNGPWWHDCADDSHWRNGYYCLEFMVDSDIPLSRVGSVGFVKHHSTTCHGGRSPCRDKKLNHYRGGARFLASVVANELQIPSALSETNGDDGKASGLNRDFESAIYEVLTEALKQLGTKSILNGHHGASRAVLRAAMAAASRGNEREMRRLFSLFSTTEEVVVGVSELIGSALGRTAEEIRTAYESY